MKLWIIYAFISMFFAGLTAVIAKKGLVGISGDVGVAIRTCFVFVFVCVFSAIAIPPKDWTLLKGSNWLWLGASALATAASWIFYYKAIKDGEVSTVALIDKGSVVVAVLLAACFLHEAITVPKLLGAAIILVGLIIVARG